MPPTSPGWSPSLLALAILCTTAGAGCHDRDRDRPTEPAPSAPPAEGGLLLEVGPGLRADLVALSRPRYAEAELEPLFARLERDGDRYCRMFYRLAPRDPARIADYLEHAETYLRADPRSKWTSRAGCWNFYRANDQKPWNDFDLVRLLYPAPTYDCYAIGLPQPYIMHSHLGCRSLTLVDFDWRIQDAHRRLLARFAAGAITGPSELRDLLATIPFKWVAHGQPPPEEGGPSPYSRLCEHDSERCRNELLRFQRRYHELTRIRLGLAALHQLDFGPGEPGTLRVLYLSNALADHYTSYLEFRRFLYHLTTALAAGERAVLIQHVGDRDDFALYQLDRTESGYRLTTRCHDFFRSDRPRRKDAVPATFLDLTAERDRSVTGCHDLLRP